MKLSEISIIKSRSGVYQDNAENRRKHRVGQRYGEDKKEDPEEGKEPSNEEWGSITSKMSAEEIQNKLNNMSALDGKVSEEQKASLRKYLEKQLEEKKKKEYDKKMDKRTDEVVDNDIKEMIEEARSGKHSKEYWNHMKESLENTLKNDLAKKKDKDRAKKTLDALNEALKGGGSEEKKEEKKPSLSKEKLESAKDGSSITIKNAQTGNTVISYTKKDGQWFSKNSMTREEVKASPEQVSKTVGGYNRKTYSTKIDLVEGTKSEPKKEASGQASEADKEDLREARKKLAYLQDNEERLIKRDGKEKYEERLKQAKDEVAKLKGEKSKEGIQEGKPKKETEESYTRVKFEDVPNSGKVNLKKYLSGKMKRSADEAWGDISKIETKDLQKMERGLVEDFNRQFDELPKSRRAEKLYAIMKVKGELSKRGKEDQEKPADVKQEPLSPQELKKAIRTKTKELSNDTLQKLKGLKKEDVEVGLDDRGRLFTNINGYDFYFDESNFEEDKNGYVRMFENNPQDVFFKKQAEAAVKLENYDIESSRKDMNFTSDEELKTFQSANSLIKNSNYSEAEVSEMKNFFNKGVKDMLASVPEHDKRRIFSKYRYFMSDSLGIDAAQKLMRDDSKGFNEIQNKDILINSALMNNGYLPIMSGSLFSNYKGEKFNEYRYEGNDDWYQEMSSRALKNADDPNIGKALRSYTEGKAYEKIRAHLSGEGELSPQAKKTLDSIENFMNKSSLEENMILYRRLKANPKSEGGLNSLNDFYKLDVGDEFEDKSFGSYAPQPNSNFGDDFQITLMAKKGSKISPIGNGLMFEQEFLANKGMKFRVVAKGTNSIAVEIVD